MQWKTDNELVGWRLLFNAGLDDASLLVVKTQVREDYNFSNVARCLLAVCPNLKGKFINQFQALGMANKTRFVFHHQSNPTQGGYTGQ